MCPGKREAPGPHLDCLEVPTESFAKIFRQSLRSPIYVHSKMMIVDDVYAIVGSANINQVFQSMSPISPVFHTIESLFLGFLKRT